MSDRLFLRNVRLLDPASGLDEKGALLVADGKVADFGAALKQPPDGARVIEGSGRCLAPGLVDMRVETGEPGFEHDETIHTLRRAAAAGGVTALVALPNTDPVIDTVPALEFIARRAGAAGGAKLFAYGAVTRATGGKELTEMGLLAEAGALGFTDGTRAVADALVMRRALSYAKAFDRPILQHPEEPALASGGLMNAGETATRLGLAGIPREAELILLERDLRLVELTGGRYHACHISTGESVEIIRRAKARGLNVTCDTAPPYFSLTEQDVGEYRTFFKLSPPLRTEDDRRAIVAGLADRTIDAIASDHAPHDQDSKRVPFIHAACGSIGVETLLVLTLDLVNKGHMSLLAALAAVTCKPADILGLKHLGRIAKGGPADLVLFDPEEPWRIEAQHLHSKSKNSCFDRRLVQGKVYLTLSDGRIAHQLESRP